MDLGNPPLNLAERLPRQTASVRVQSRGSDRTSLLGRLAVVKVRFELPHELPMSAFSRMHPEAVLRLMRFKALPKNRMLGEWEYVGPFDSGIFNEVSQLTDVTSVAPIVASDSLARAQLVSQQPAWLALERDLRLLYRHPMILQGGSVTLEVAAPISRLKRLLERLRRTTPAVSVVRFGRDPLTNCPPTLSVHQRTLLLQALAAGYFDVPRRITLTRLANRLHRSKSAVSEALALVEQRLAEASATPHL